MKYIKDRVKQRYLREEGGNCTGITDYDRGLLIDGGPRVQETIGRLYNGRPGYRRRSGRLRSTAMRRTMQNMKQTKVRDLMAAMGPYSENE